MSSLEKELSFVNLENIEIKVDLCQVLKDKLSKNSLPKRFRDTFKISLPFVFGMTSFVLSIFGMLLAFTIVREFNLGFFTYMLSIPLAVYAMVKGMTYSQFLHKQEENNEYRLKMLPFADDLAFVLEKFANQRNIKLGVEVSDSYRPEIKVSIYKDGQKNELITFSDYVLKGNTPDVWYRRLNFNYEDLLEKDGQLTVESMLLKIKEFNKEKWFELCSGKDIKLITDTYESMCENKD